jgi:hypothetical protein
MNTLKSVVLIGTIRSGRARRPAAQADPSNPSINGLLRSFSASLLLL